MLRTAPRHERRAAIDRVAALVGVGTSGQDWDVEHADASRVDAFCDAYEREPWTVDERLALMRLIVASCDDSLRAGGSPALARVEAALRRDYAIHFHTVQRWACLEDPLEDAYAITPMMRAVYASCTPAVVQAALANDAVGVAGALTGSPPQGELDDALLAAAAHADAEVVRALLAAGASPTTREESGATPLLAAVSSGFPATIPALLAAGCAIDATSDMGWTALHVATMNDDLAAVEALLAARASVTIRDDNGYDPLMTAAESGRRVALELLLAHGARIGATNRSGEDALAIARRHADEGRDPERLRILARLRRAREDETAAPRGG